MTKIKETNYRDGSIKQFSIQPPLTIYPRTV